MLICAGMLRAATSRERPGQFSAVALDLVRSEREPMLGQREAGHFVKSVGEVGEQFAIFLVRHSDRGNTPRSQFLELGSM